MTNTIKNEVVKALEKTRGVRGLEFIADNELKVVISNINTDLTSEVEKTYINLKVDGLVDGYRENNYGKEAYITINKEVRERPKFTDCEKKYFRLDVLEYAFYKKELDGTDFETLMENTSKPADILNMIKDIANHSDEYPSFITNIIIKIALTSILKTYYYINGTYDYFTLYQTAFFKEENENADEYLKYADDVMKRFTDENGEIKEKRNANLVLSVLGVALAKVLREQNMSIFEKFSELI